MKSWHWADIPVPVPPTLTPGERRGQGRATRGDRERSLLSWFVWMRAGCLESLPISPLFYNSSLGIYCELMDAHGDPRVYVFTEPNKSTELQLHTGSAWQTRQGLSHSSSQTPHGVTSTQPHPKSASLRDCPVGVVSVWPLSWRAAPGSCKWANSTTPTLSSVLKPPQAALIAGLSGIVCVMLQNLTGQSANTETSPAPGCTARAGLRKPPVSLVLSSHSSCSAALTPSSAGTEFLSVPNMGYVWIPHFPDTSCSETLHFSTCFQGQKPGVGGGEGEEPNS